MRVKKVSESGVMVCGWLGGDRVFWVEIGEGIDDGIDVDDSR